MTEVESSEAPPEERQRPKEERRAGRRFRLEVEVSFTSESQFYSGLTGDISEGGLFVATYHLRPVGTRLDLALTLPSGEVHARGNVRWVRDAHGDTPPGLGVELDALSVEARKAIEVFLRQRAPLYHDLDEPT
jgi:uncharacterized protein (TIGR02266 family)